MASSLAHITAIEIMALFAVLDSTEVINDEILRTVIVFLIEGGEVGCGSWNVNGSDDRVLVDYTLDNYRVALFLLEGLDHIDLFVIA